MKASELKDEQFVVDAKGKRVGVLLDLETYERLREAEEDLADIRAYDASASKARSEVKARQFSSLPTYRAKRLSRRK
jgi:hypothetical protein